MNRQATIAVLVGLLISSAFYYIWAMMDDRPLEAVPVVDSTPAEPPQPSHTRGSAHTVHEGLLKIDARLGSSHMLANAASSTHVALLAETGDIQGTFARVPASVVLVIDRSGSMQGDRIEHAKAASEFVLDSLEPGDHISIITYSSGATVTLPRTEISASNRARIRQSIRSISVGGGTCISCGLDAAEPELLKADGVSSRLILLSDGQANSGIQDPYQLGLMAKELERRGNAVATVGVGLDYNESLMSSIAVAGNGAHYFVEDPALLAQTLQAELTSMRELVARRVIITFTLAEGVSFVKGYDRDFEVEGQRVMVSLGDMPANTERTVLFELGLPAGAEGERVITDFQVTYENLVTEKNALVADTLSMVASVDTSTVAAGTDANVAARVEQAALAHALAEANKQLAAGHYDEAEQTMQRQYQKSMEANTSLGNDRLKDQLDTFKGATEGMAAPAVRTGKGGKRASKKNKALERSLAY